MSRTIDSYVSTIRNNIYGKQIREAIASALEGTYDAALPKFVKLWENATPEASSGFQGQTITVTPGYNLYLIIFKDTKSSWWLIDELLYASLDTSHTYAQYTYEDNGVWVTAFRSVYAYPSTGEMRFEGGMADGVPNNGVLIPLYIFGSNI